MESGISAVALTGTIGAGKTTLAEAISQELHERGIRHALIDLDWLGQVYPIPESHGPYGYELALENLRTIWPNFQAAGADKAIVAGTLLDGEHRLRLQSALGGLPMAVALIEAPQAALEARIRSRNAGRLRDDFLARTAQIAQEIEAAHIHDFKVLSHGRSPRDAAREILSRLQWISS